MCYVLLSLLQATNTELKKPKLNSTWYASTCVNYNIRENSKCAET